MNEAGLLIIAIIAGFLLGVFFFGGLWWTTKKAVLSKSPVLWFLASLFLRLGIVLSGIYFLSGGHWKRILICLLGFIVARILVMRFLQPSEVKQNQ